MENYLQTFQGMAGSGHFGLIMLLVSFLGGLLASVSPCSLAMLPIIVGYVGGYSEGKPIKILSILEKIVSLDDAEIKDNSNAIVRQSI